jgi:hypothetical protein
VTETIEPMAAQIYEQKLAEELVAQAREEGVQLVGPGGLLTGLTKSVVETALEEELSGHLGYDAASKPSFRGPQPQPPGPSPEPYMSSHDKACTTSPAAVLAAGTRRLVLLKWKIKEPIFVGIGAAAGLILHWPW